MFVGQMSVHDKALNTVVSKRNIVCLQITNQNLNEYMSYKSVLFSINHSYIYIHTIRI